MTNNKARRKANRANGFDYSTDGFYFVTICTQYHKHCFGDVENGKMILNMCGKNVEKCWLEIPSHFPDVSLDEFVIMPNHVHGILIVENSSPAVVGNKIFCSLQDAAWQMFWARSLSSVVRGFKIGVTKSRREQGDIGFHWQKSFYDHVIQDEESLYQIREYIRNNPLKWDLEKNCVENICELE